MADPVWASWAIGTTRLPIRLTVDREEAQPTNSPLSGSASLLPNICSIPADGRSSFRLHGI